MMSSHSVLVGPFPHARALFPSARAHDTVGSRRTDFAEELDLLMILLPVSEPGSRILEPVHVTRPRFANCRFALNRRLDVGGKESLSGLLGMV